MANNYFIKYRATAATTAAAVTATRAGECQSAMMVINPSTEEDTANAMTADFSGLLTGPIDFARVTIRNASNVLRVPQGAVTTSGVVVTINDTGLAATDTVVVEAFATPLF